jgi:hypothetical protein
VHSVVEQAHFEVMITVDKPNDGAASTAASKSAAANMRHTARYLDMDVIRCCTADGRAGGRLEIMRV